MTKRFQRMCARVCSILMIPMLVASPMDAAENVQESVVVVETPATETPAVDTPNTETAPVETPTPTPVPNFKSAVPDTAFRKVINDMFFDGAAKDEDKLSDDMLEKMAAFTGKLDVRGLGLVNLKGIEYMTGLTELDCAHNNLQLLDVSALKKLKKVDASYNDLIEMTVGADSTLEELDCSDNNLTLLNLATITSVTKLDCSDNKLSMLNVAGLHQLTTLDCSNNMLRTLAIEGLVALKELYADGNALLSLDVSALQELSVLECRKSEITLPVEAIGKSFCGVVLPEGAMAPANISDSGTYDEATRAIVWDKIKGVPESFTYTFAITGKIQNVTVTVKTDKTSFVEKAITVGNVGTIAITSKGYNKVKISWNGADGASGYRIYRSTSPTGTFTKIKSITSSSKVTYTNTGLSCGTTYYYKVRAYRLIDGNYYFGAYSDVVSGKAIPAAPSGVSVTKASKKYVKVSWNKVSGASGYRVYRSRAKTSGFSKIKTVTSGAILSCKKKTARSKKYYYKVRAYKTVNGQKVWGKYSTAKAKTLK